MNRQASTHVSVCIRLTPFQSRFIKLAGAAGGTDQSRVVRKLIDELIASRDMTSLRRAAAEAEGRWRRRQR